MDPKDRLDEKITVTSDDGDTYVGTETVITYDDDGNQKVEMR